MECATLWILRLTEKVLFPASFFPTFQLVHNQLRVNEMVGRQTKFYFSKVPYQVLLWAGIHKLENKNTTSSSFFGKKAMMV